MKKKSNQSFCLLIFNGNPREDERYKYKIIRLADIAQEIEQAKRCERIKNGGIRIRRRIDRDRIEFVWIVRCNRGG